MTATTRIGLILPAGNATCEPDMYSMAPQGVTIHTERMYSEKLTLESLEGMNRDVPRAVRYLLPTRVDVIAYACTSGSFYGGVGHDDKVTKTIVEISGGLPVVVTSSAVVEALVALGIKSVSVATPYPDPIVERLQAFLTGRGFEVLAAEGLPTLYNYERSALPPESAYEMAKRVFQPKADGVFLSCTNWRAVEVIDQLERELGRPVVTSNQATMWACLGRLGIATPVTGYGGLFQVPAGLRSAAATESTAP